MEKVKMYLFAKWMGNLYHTDILNAKDMAWYLERVNYFEKEIYSKYVQNGNVERAVIYMNGLKEQETSNHKIKG